MKSILLIFLFFSTFGFSQGDWKNLILPTNVLGYNSTNYKYYTDNLGRINCIYTFNDGTNDVLQVDQYDSYNGFWFNLHYEVLTTVPDKLHLDYDNNNIAYFTFVSDQSGSPLINFYTIESNSVNLKFRKLFTGYDAFSNYDFKAVQLDEYYWFFSNTSGLDYSLGSWNSGLVDIDIYNIPQFSGLNLNNFQMQQVGDTLWFAAGDGSSNRLQVLKTHKSSISFVTFDGSPSGFLKNSGNDIQSNYTTLISNRIDKLSVLSIDATNSNVDLLFTNGMLNLSIPSGNFIPLANNVANCQTSFNAFIIASFGQVSDFSSTEIKVLKKKFLTDTWDTVGSPSTEIFEVNAINPTNFDINYNFASNRKAVSYDLPILSTKRLKIFNTPPSIDSLQIVSENTLCPNTNSMNTFSVFSLWDDNNDPLRITSITSSNSSVLLDSDITYYSSFQNGKTQNFVVNIVNTNAGLTTLSFVVTDGFDTITFTKDITITDYTIGSVTDGSFCGTGSPQLDATSINGAGSILWYDAPTLGNLVGVGTPFFTPVISSNSLFYAEANDNNCYSPRVVVNAIILPIPTVDAGIDQTVCENDPVTLIGSGALSYTWDNGVTDAVIFNPTFTQSYTVTGTDGNGCQNTDVVTVNVNALPFVDAGFDQVICDGASVTLTAIGASTYSWDNSITDGVSFNPSSTTTYSVVGTDANGCQDTDAVLVTVNSLPIVSISASGPTTFCMGGSVDLVSTPELFYTWSEGSGTQTATIFNSGTYTVTVTDVNACTAVSNSISVVVNPLPVVDAGVDQTVCSGAPVVLTGAGALSYTWDNGVIDGAVFNPTFTLTYNVTGTDANGCQNTDMVDVNINGLPSIDAGFDQVVCDGNSITLVGNGGISYSWDNSVIDGVTFTPITSTTYTIIGTDFNGCQNSDQVVVTVNPLPSPIISHSGSNIICQGQSIDLTSSPDVFYSWSDGSSSQTITVFTAGSYSVTLTDANGCSSISAPLDVFVNNLPIVDGGIDQTLCENSQITLSGSGALTYIWDNSVFDNISFSQAPGTITYTVSGTDTNGCTNTDQVDVTVIALPIVDAGLDQSICEGSAVTLLGSGASTLNWDNSIVDGTPFVQPVGTITYTLTGIDGFGCQNTDLVDITVNPNPTPTISANGPLTFCEGGSVDLTSSEVVGNLWSDGSITQATTVSSSGLFYDIVTDLNGCVGYSDTLTITVNPLPIINAGADQAICAGSSVTLTGVGALTYIWDNSVVNALPFTPTNTAIYTVTGLDNNGCQNTDAVTVTVNSLPIVDAGFDQNVCEGGSVTLSGNGASTYTWDNGVTDGVAFNPALTTTYSVTGTDANGCQNTDLVSIAVNPLPTVFSNSSIEICEDESTTLTASSTSSNYFWFDQAIGGLELAFGPNFVTPSLNSSQTYYVQTLDNGCFSNRLAVDVIVNSNPQIILNSNNSNCGNTDGSITASLAGGTAPFSYYWSNGEQQVLTINSLSTGSYYFNVEDSKGCKSIGVAEIVPSNVTITPTIVNPSCFESNDGSISVDVQGLSGNLTYLWSTGSGATSINNLFAGSYEITVFTDANCTVSASYLLTQPDNISNNLVLTQSTCGNNDGQISNTATTGGTGTYTYLWSNGSSQQNLTTIPSGFYSLTTTDLNGCSVTDDVYLSDLNAPTVEGLITNQTCNMSDGAIDITINTIGNDAVQNVTWSTGQNTQDISALTIGNYVSFVTTQNNCFAVNGWKVFPAKPMTQEICLVTVDSVTTTNLVVWEKIQTNDISHYNIYRESNQIGDYQLIDTVDFSSLSVFNDVVASPKVRSWRYKISAVDVCNVESDLSIHHKTVHLNVFDIGAGNTKITWDQYEGNLSFSNYVLWRHTNTTGWELVSSLPTNVVDFTDNTPFLTDGLDYMVEVELDEICTATVWRAQDFNVSRSNKNRGIFNPGEGTGHSNNSIIEFENPQISVNIYPNPFDNEFNFELKGTTKLNIQVFDVSGKKLMQDTCNEGVNKFSMQTLESGVYFVNFNLIQENKVVKITKQ